MPSAYNNGRLISGTAQPPPPPPPEQRMYRIQNHGSAIPAPPPRHQHQHPHGIMTSNAVATPSVVSAHMMPSPALLVSSILDAANVHNHNSTQRYYQEEIQRLRQQQHDLQQLHHHQQQTIRQQQQQQQQQRQHLNLSASSGPIVATYYTLPAGNVAVSTAPPSVAVGAAPTIHSHPTQHPRIVMGNYVLEYPAHNLGIEVRHDQQQQRPQHSSLSRLQLQGQPQRLPLQVQQPHTVQERLSGGIIPQVSILPQSQKQDFVKQNSSSKILDADSTGSVLSVPPSHSPRPLNALADSAADTDANVKDKYGVTISSTNQKSSKRKRVSLPVKKTQKKSETQSKDLRKDSRHDLPKPASTTESLIFEDISRSKATSCPEEEITTDVPPLGVRDCQHDSIDQPPNPSSSSLPSLSTPSLWAQEQSTIIQDFERNVITPMNIQNIVRVVSSLVAEEVRLCHYGYDGCASEQERRKSEEIIKRANFAADAVEKFANDVLFPNILAAFAEDAHVVVEEEKESGGVVTNVVLNVLKKKKKNQEMEKKQGAGDIDTSMEQEGDDVRTEQRLYNRVFVAVLLNLREVLMINAKQMLLGLEDKDNEATEDFAVKVHSLSTAVTLNAISRIEDSTTRASVMELSMDAIAKYERAHDEFASCLKRLDVRAIGLTPGGKVMKKYENVAFRVSYNIARLEHPLVTKQSVPYSVEVPPSNATFVALVDPSKSSLVAADLCNPRGSRKKQILETYRKRMKKFHVS